MEWHAKYRRVKLHYSHLTELTSKIGRKYTFNLLQFTNATFVVDVSTEDVHYRFIPTLSGSALAEKVASSQNYIEENDKFNSPGNILPRKKIE